MKKRILALLLAAMITASMAACSSSTGDQTDDTGNNTNQEQNNGDNTNNTTPPAEEVVTWQDTNDTVYVIGQNLFLTGVENTQDVQIALQFTKLARVKVGSNGKSIVVMNGKQYTTLTNQLTTEDLLGEKFATCDPTIMYISDNDVAVRKYAYKNSDLIKKLNLNDTVQVVAKGDKWVKIQYDADNQYFVNADYVSDKEVMDANDINNYPAFTDVAEPYYLYVVEEKLTLRFCPSTESNEVMTLVYGDMLLVQKTGTDNDGDTWYRVKYTKQGTAGQGLIVKEGYVAQSKYVSTTNPMPSLDEKLQEYPSFTKNDAPVTLYVSTDAKSLNARKTPNASNADNIAFAYAQKSPVVVVATGTQNGIYWAMVESENQYYFVSYAYLTANSDGKPAAPTLDQVLAQYPTFSKLSVPKTMAAKDVTNCNPEPEERVADKDTLQLTAGEVVTVEAEGAYGGKTWYVFKKGDNYFFAGAEMFDANTEAAG
ncbi:MAG: hypothetical protein IJW49_02325 [Clostridia bacterium]|nr:hypothetical protein [Clostridia bacterium]